MNPHIKDVCKIGQGPRTCKYLGLNPQGWECLKLTKLKAFIDSREMGAKGDNCEGREDLNVNDN